MSSNRRTVSDIKTALRAKVRSKPRVTGSEFLEMFILEKNKARLEQEKIHVEKRHDQIDKDISVIEGELENLGERVSQDGERVIKRIDNKKQKYKKNIKKMTIDY